ncbi:SlyX family protein [Bartonella sp. A05]|uniref:SlyX family protein n=1 Tax=Bartonella sp. A05 TaxID=2967261 RepID=UPI0022A9D9F7|nr:SlyX family protein [Bartonella sp. A05]MCZ2203330.1 SlyX family protein [Bartonella sp. A05]
MVDESRLTELEMKLAHQEKLLEELSCVVTDQWKGFDALSQKFNVLMKRFADLEERSFSDNSVAPSL